MTERGAPEGYILFDRGPGDGPALFRAPRQLIEAASPEQVPQAFDMLEQALGDGRWIAGAASYELGYALEPALAPLLPRRRRAPLMRFGVFDAPGEVEAEAMLAHAEQEAARMRLADFRVPLSRGAYDAAFDEAMEEIRSGGFYQINLTQALKLRRTGSALGLYAALRAGQPVEHGALVALGDPVLLSRSPELFLRSTGIASSRPAP